MEAPVIYSRAVLGHSLFKQKNNIDFYCVFRAPSVTKNI